jgi:hypothetical protein
VVWEAIIPRIVTEAGLLPQDLVDTQKIFELAP